VGLGFSLRQACVTGGPIIDHQTAGMLLRISAGIFIALYEIYSLRLDHLLLTRSQVLPAAIPLREKNYPVM
jgi:hypothetical protein